VSVQVKRQKKQLSFQEVTERRRPGSSARQPFTKARPSSRMRQFRFGRTEIRLTLRVVLGHGFTGGPGTFYAHGRAVTRTAFALNL
jgi:hypothetical protein